MPVVTALRPRANDCVAVELDNAPWRVVPGEAVVRAGLTVGAAVDRNALRIIRRELRRADARDIAIRALRATDRSRSGVEARLDARGVAPSLRDETVAMLERTGLVDDQRFARGRAEALARRGYGD